MTGSRSYVPSPSSVVVIHSFIQCATRKTERSIGQHACEHALVLNRRVAEGELCEGCPPVEEDWPQYPEGRRAKGDQELREEEDEEGGGLLGLGAARTLCFDGAG